MARPPAAAPNVRILSLMLFLLAVGAFLPGLSNQFVNFDDPVYVVNNLHVNRGLTWAGLGWAFHSTDGGIWLPLTWISHMLDCQVYGLQPWGHHLTSVLFHAVNAVLLFLVFHRMTRVPWRSFFVAALFAVHPLRVESVAWVAERKDVLSGLFWMLALLAYVQFVQKSEARSQKSDFRFLASGFYWLALFFFACGLLCKPMLVTLPLVLLLLDYWPLRRISNLKFQISNSPARRPSTLNPSASAGGSGATTPKRPAATVREHGGSEGGQPSTILEKLPFFALSLAASIVAFAVQKHDKAVIVLERLPPLVRIENAAVSYVRYVGKTFWPDNLCVFYPYPDHWPWVFVLAAAVLLAVVSLICIWQRRQNPWLLVGWLWFLGTLVPVIGLVQVGEQAMADRYTYIPQIGLFIGLVWGFHALARNWKWQRPVLSVAAVASILVCVPLTWRQIGWWKDSESLFRRAIDVTDKNVIAHINLGVALDAAGRTGEAIEQYQAALRGNPNSAIAYSDLGLALLHQGRPDEAAGFHQKALAINPDYANAYFSLGNDYLQLGQVAEAITNYQKAVEINPAYAEAYYDLGNVFMNTGLLDEALTNFQKAVAINPGLAEAQDNLGNVLLKMGRTDEAIACYRKAVDISPRNVNAHNNLGTALMRTGRLEEAITQYRKALELKPDNLNARANLGLALFKSGRTREAMVTAQSALQLANAQTNAAQAELLQKQLQLYQSGPPAR